MNDENRLLLLYDGECRFCRRRIRTLKKIDRHNSIDICDLHDFNPFGYDIDIPLHELEKQIHAVLPDGRVKGGMDAVRAVLRATGHGWIAAPTGWPVLRSLFDGIYRCIAENRHRLQ